MLAEKIGLQPGDMLYEFNGHHLDEYGDTTVSWSPDKVPFYNLISRLKLGETVHLVVYRNGKRKDFRFTFALTPAYPIRTMYPDYETIDYEMIGGMVVMQMAINHLGRLAGRVPYIIKYAKMENRTDPVLVITNMLPGSYVKQRNIFVSGDVIKQVNGVPVGTLQEFRAALDQGLKSDSLTFKTEEDVFGVFAFKELLQDEERLSKDFTYPITDTVKQLLTEINYGSKTKKTS